MDREHVTQRLEGVGGSEEGRGRPWVLHTPVYCRRPGEANRREGRSGCSVERELWGKDERTQGVGVREEGVTGKGRTRKGDIGRGRCGEGGHGEVMR